MSQTAVVRSHIQSRLHIVASSFLYCALFLLYTQQSAEAQRRSEQTDWTTGLGLGVLFLEGDDEFNPSLAIEAKTGYDLDDSYTLEGSFTYLPYMDAQSHTVDDPDVWHLDSTQGFRTALDLLYYLQERAVEGELRPLLAATGGVMYYSNSLADDGHFDPFAGAGFGVEYKIDKNWSARGDYRLLAVFDDGEINHHSLISLLYRWDKGNSDFGRRAALGMPERDAPASMQPSYFEFDKATLTPAAREILRKNAAWHADNPDAKVIVEGHCDERGTSEYNLALGQRRAQSAYEYLRNLGIAESRMETISYGEEYPAVAESSEAAWSKNRRVECVAE